MKLKRSLIGAFALATVLGSTNIGVISAQEVSDNSLVTETSIECQRDNQGCPPNCHGNHGGKGIFMKSVEELQKDGTLSEKDVENIKEFRKKDKEEIKQKILKEKFSKVDEMVSQRVITKEQGEKLKQAMEKNMNNAGKESN